MTAGGRRAHSSMSGGRGYPRSWHPSPYGSEDDASAADGEPQFYKEEKKNRIKMEIARRRQQIEENACLHDELTRLAKLRETAEISDRLNVVNSTTTPWGASPMMSPAIVTTSTGTSVLKSVDEILRDGHHHSANVMTAAGNLANTMNAYNSDLYTSSAAMAGMYDGTAASHGHHHHHRVTDFSPINSDLIDHHTSTLGGMNSSSSRYAYPRSSSADPTYGGGGVGGGYHYLHNPQHSSAMMASSMDPYGGKYSKYSTSAATAAGIGYRKY